MTKTRNLQRLTLRVLFTMVLAVLLAGAPAHADTVIDDDGNLNADFGQLRYWLDASVGVNAVISGAAATDGGTVAEWENLATSGGLNPTTGGNFPTYHTGVINGLPVVRFNGANDNLLANNGAIPLFTADKTLVAVYSAALPGSACCGDLVQTGAFTGLGAVNDGGVMKAQINYAGVVVQGADNVTGTPIIGVGSINGGVGTLYVDGVQQGAPTAGFSSSNTFLRIGTRGAGTQQFDGDAAEVLVFDGALSTAQRMEVNNYLSDKYNIAVATPIIDEDVTNSNQISTKPFAGDTVRLAAVNFYYSDSSSIVSKTDTLHGIGFDNIAVPQGVPPATLSGVDLFGNTSGVQLDLNFGATSDNSPGSRNLTAIIGGTDGNVLTDVSRGNRYMSSAGIGNHVPNIITFNGLNANQDVFVQLLGGQYGWGGVPEVFVNGNSIGNWTTNTGPANQLSMYGFYATADGSGTVEIDLQVNAGNFAGIAGVILHSDQLAANTTVDDAITSSEQVYNNVFGDKTAVLAAVNFYNNDPRAGADGGPLGSTTIHGIAFDDVFVGSGASNVTDLSLAANRPTVLLTTNFELFLDRDDNVVTTGQDAAALNSLLRDVHALGVAPGGACCDANTFKLAGLGADREVFVQLFGGEEGWSADIEVIVNGLNIGTWTSNADAGGGTAGSFGFYVTTDAQGELLFDLNAINVGGGGNPNFGGISGFLVLGVAPTPAALPAGLAMLGIVASRRRRR